MYATPVLQEQKPACSAHSMGFWFLVVGWAALSYRDVVNADIAGVNSRKWGVGFECWASRCSARPMGFGWL
jgi:hypothetical protein